MPDFVLPASFNDNTLDRMVSFLQESNKIEGIDNIDYSQPANQNPEKGHFGAFVISQQSAIENKPLTIRMIRQWQSLITKEQQENKHHIEDNEIGHIRSPNLPKNVRVGRHVPPHYDNVPTLLDALIEKINEKLNSKKIKELKKDDAKFVKFIGKYFLEFEKIHPFADGNGRVGRLLMQYIATRCSRPIIVIPVKERNAYIDAHESREDMRNYIAKKVQDAIFGEGKTLFIKTKQLSGASSKYQSLDGKTTLIYEWHSLNAGFSKKRKEPPELRDSDDKIIDKQGQSTETTLTITSKDKK